MKILVLADVESKYLWDYFEKEKLEGIDLILSCGDLKADYLSFLASFSKVPILYVRGNHDDGYADKEPEGCICIEDKIYVYIYLIFYTYTAFWLFICIAIIVIASHI